MNTLAVILIGGSLIAFAFLLYTLTHLDQLRIGIFHPRVLVEAGLGIFSLTAGVILLLASR